MLIKPGPATSTASTQVTNELLHLFGRKPQALGRVWIRLQWLEQLHGRRHGQIAMGRHFGRFERGLGARTRIEFVQRSGQCLQEFIFYRKHAGILRVRLRVIHIACCFVV